jgi:hypothetical protein
MTGPRDLPDVRDRQIPFDEDDDGVAGYLPELRDERYHKRSDENEEAEL